MKLCSKLWYNGSLFFGIRVIASMKKSLWLMGALCLSVMPVHAQQALVSQEEVSVDAYTCVLVTGGIYNIATNRQSGMSKQNAQKKMNEDLKYLSQKFTSKQFVGFVGQSWQNGLDIIYDMPVLKSEQDKQAFLSAVTNKAFNECLKDLEAK